MIDGQRMDRDDFEPDKHGAAGAPRWTAYLDWVRADLAAAVLALPADEQRTGSVPSGWTPIELLSHALHMEQRWFVWGFLGEVVDEPWGDWTVDEPWHQEEGRWAVAADDVPAEYARHAGQLDVALEVRK
ncbi:hypothetical protein GCM10023350_20690 [Nocardioides endophyticus]|uniref:DUF664 domain-containing protein n=1 Tax=Nocardioides endophyticus TaxID=1353775 RepID=A0ABP8YQ80_9ACTN